MFKTKSKLFNGFYKRSLLVFSKYSQSTAVSDVVKTEEKDLYPPIYDISLKSEKEREFKTWTDKICNLPTIEQKLIELNMPKYYGWKSANIRDESIPLCAADFVNYSTRTYTIKELPIEYYQDVQETAERYLPEVKDYIENLIYLKDKLSRKNGKQNNEQISSTEFLPNFILLLNKFLQYTLSDSAQHLRKSQTDIDPRVEAFWFLGGIEWSKEEKDDKNYKDLAEAFEYNTKPMQSYASPKPRLRINDILPPVLDMSESEQYSSRIPICHYDPATAEFEFEHQTARLIPGFWNGSENEFSQLFYHSMDFIEALRRKYGDSYDMESIVEKKLNVAGFTQALSEAMNMGYDPVNDLPRPVVSQSVSLCFFIVIFK